MAGNQEGGLKAKAKNLARDPDYYKKLSSMGGKSPGAFRAFRIKEYARRAGEKGRISRYKKVVDNNAGQD